jgi:hypothetical protein
MLAQRIPRGFHENVRTEQVRVSAAERAPDADFLHCARSINNSVTLLQDHLLVGVPMTQSYRPRQISRWALCRHAGVYVS